MQGKGFYFFFSCPPRTWGWWRGTVTTAVPAALRLCGGLTLLGWEKPGWHPSTPGNGYGSPTRPGPPTFRAIAATYDCPRARDRGRRATASPKTRADTGLLDRYLRATRSWMETLRPRQLPLGKPPTPPPLLGVGGGAGPPPLFMPTPAAAPPPHPPLRGGRPLLLPPSALLLRAPASSTPAPRPSPSSRPARCGPHGPSGGATGLRGSPAPCPSPRPLPDRGGCWPRRRQPRRWPRAATSSAGPAAAAARAAAAADGAAGVKGVCWPGGWAGGRTGGHGCRGCSAGGGGAARPPRCGGRAGVPRRHPRRRRRPRRRPRQPVRHFSPWWLRAAAHRWPRAGGRRRWRWLWRRRRRLRGGGGGRGRGRHRWGRPPQRRRRHPPAAAGERAVPRIPAGVARGRGAFCGGVSLGNLLGGGVRAKRRGKVGGGMCGRPCRR